jgi:hypothetical protein
MQLLWLHMLGKIRCMFNCCIVGIMYSSCPASTAMTASAPNSSFTCCRPHNHQRFLHDDLWSLLACQLQQYALNAGGAGHSVTTVTNAKCVAVHVLKFLSTLLAFCLTGSASSAVVSNPLANLKVTARAARRLWQHTMRGAASSVTAALAALTAALAPAANVTEQMITPALLMMMSSQRVAAILLSDVRHPNGMWSQQQRQPQQQRGITAQGLGSSRNLRSLGQRRSQVLTARALLAQMPRVQQSASSSSKIVGMVAASAAGHPLKALTQQGHIHSCSSSSSTQCIGSSSSSSSWVAACQQQQQQQQKGWI